jgi:hypothetical protein
MSRKHTERRRQRRPYTADAELKAILALAMVEAGATAAAVYAYHKTDVILSVDNEDCLPHERLRAWNASINKYCQLIAGPPSRASLEMSVAPFPHRPSCWFKLCMSGPVLVQFENSRIPRPHIEKTNRYRITPDQAEFKRTRLDLETRKPN